MSKKILLFLLIVVFFLLVFSCNIRNDRSRFEYIKLINEFNYIKNVIINSNKLIEIDYELLFSVFLIRWKILGKVKFDNFNKKFFSVINKYLEFELV